MKKEKQMLLDDMQGQIKSSNSFIVVQYTGLHGSRAHLLRCQLRDIGASFEVMRKRMLLHAAKNLGVSFNIADFPGHIGVVLGMNDPVEAAKIVTKFSADNDKALQLLGGYIEGATVSIADMARLASLPGKDAMRAEFLSLLEAPAAGVLGAMDALLSSVVYCLDNKIQGGCCDQEA